MTISPQEVARLEWVNYAATLPIAHATPGLNVLLGEEVILTSNTLFPYLDVTHACLLKSSPETIDGLIDKIIDYFKLQALPTTIFVSPACTPADLTERLLEKKFVRNPREEAWLAYSHLRSSPIPALLPRIEVRQITRKETLTFVETMVAAFEMPEEFVAGMVQLTEPSICLPDVHHYLAFSDDQPVGTCSLICYQDFGIVGGVGVTPAYRGRGAVTNLIIRAAMDAQTQGIDTLLLQTAAAMPLERLLRISGFKRMFTRVAYTLHD